MPWIVCEASSLWLSGISVCQHLLQLPASPSSSFSGSRESHPSQLQLCICPETCKDPQHFSVVFHCTAAFSLMSCPQIPTTQQPQPCFAWAPLPYLWSARATKLKMGVFWHKLVHLSSLYEHSLTLPVF